MFEVWAAPRRGILFGIPAPEAKTYWVSISRGGANRRWRGVFRSPKCDPEVGYMYYPVHKCGSVVADPGTWCRIGVLFSTSPASRVDSAPASSPFFLALCAFVSALRVESGGSFLVFFLLSCRVPL
jgi:hypothetical protein